MKKLFVCALAVAMVFAFTAPTMAADWNFYGSARMATFSEDIDTKVVGVESDTDTDWALQTNSRIGANVAAGDVTGRFEYGVDFGSTTNGNDAARVRLLYGTWNFGAGTMLVGKAYGPIAEFYSNQVWGNGGDTDLLPYGMAYRGRVPQIAFKFGGFNIALQQPKAAALAAVPPADATDVTLPQLAMSYKFATDMFSVKPYFGYQTYDSAINATEMKSVDSMVYGIGGKVNFGPAYFAANIYGGNNVGNYGLWNKTATTAVLVGTEVKDATSMNYAAVIGFKASDMWAFEAGYGAESSETDYALKQESDSNAYYIQCTINLAPGVMIIPEFGMTSDGETKNPLGVAGTTEAVETTYFGAKWQINF